MTGEIDWEMYDEIIQRCKELGINKNGSYGTESLKLFNGIAILSRINDKVQRLNHLCPKQINGITITEESIEDTIDDLINYAIYLRMLRAGGIT